MGSRRSACSPTASCSSRDTDRRPSARRETRATPQTLPDVSRARRWTVMAEILIRGRIAGRFTGKSRKGPSRKTFARVSGPVRKGHFLPDAYYVMCCYGDFTASPDPVTFSPMNTLNPSLSRKFLIVDDDHRLRDLLRRYLSEQGF